MILQEPVSGRCPNCGEPVELLIDSSVSSQEYIEDCQVCCRPMVVSVNIDESEIIVLELRSEEE